MRRDDAMRRQKRARQIEPVACSVEAQVAQDPGDMRPAAELRGNLLGSRLLQPEGAHCEAGHGDGDTRPMEIERRQARRPCRASDIRPRPSTIVRKSSHFRP
jgi:hypothetical protein